MSTKRWIDEDSEATELERAVLTSGLDAEPPPAAEHAVWSELASLLVPPLPPGGAGPAPPPAATTVGATALTGASTLVTLGKGFALGVAVSLGAVGVGRLTSVQKRPTTPAASVAAVVPHPPESPAVSSPNPQPDLPRDSTPSFAAEPSDAPARMPAPPSRPSPPSSGSVSPPVTDTRSAGTSSVAAFPLPEGHTAPPKSQLEEEATMLRRARAELRAGNVTAAFATLEAARGKFSAPELTQEREALLIELLYRSGERASAVARARSFLGRYPQSPHVAQVRSIANTDTP